MSTNSHLSMRKRSNGHGMDRRTFVAALGVAGATAFSAASAQTTANANLPPAEVRATLPTAVDRGLVPFRYFGFLVYHLNLWAPKGFDLQRYGQQAFALTLNYARELKGTAIAESSISEMKRGGTLTAEQQARWLAFMTTAFPNVKAGDRITGAHDGKGMVMFWHNGQATARLQGADFARLFFGIWLAPTTSAPALRDALLKAQND